MSAMSSATLPSTATVVPSVSAMPPAVARYAETGESPSTFRRDLVTVTNQVPRWGYFGFALLSGWMAWKAYKVHAAAQRSASPPKS